MDKLEDMMKADGWILGYHINWGVKYWSFHKDGFEIALNDVDVVTPLDKFNGTHFKAWKPQSQNPPKMNNGNK